LQGPTFDPADAETAVVVGSPPRGTAFAALVAKLSVVNAVVAVSGLVTGPLLAQALGASGRGTLAAILVPATVAPWVFGFGLGEYVARMAARQANSGEAFGTVGALSLLIGLAGAVAGIPIALFLADGRQVVLVMLLIAFCALPLTLVQQVAGHLAVGLAEFRAVSLSRLMPAVISLAAIPALFVLENLTVTSASIVVFVGGFLAGLPLLPVIARAGRLRLGWTTAKGAFRFGATTWVGTLSSIANARLDQLIMIKLVSERELGLYAVAVTLASFSAIGVGALAVALFPQVARGDFALAMRSTRVTLLLLALLSVLVGLVAPVALPSLFGAEFRHATVMAWILLAAGLPLAGAFVLGSALIAIGHPGAASIGQIAGVVVTGIGLPVFVPLLGGEGAALVTLIAYTLQFILLAGFAHRRYGGRIRDFFIPRREDFAWLRTILSAALRRVLHANDRTLRRPAS
jgi:O-antigen/teichoic acid export membrane protein